MGNKKNIIIGAAVLVVLGLLQAFLKVETPPPEILKTNVQAAMQETDQNFKKMIANKDPNLKIKKVAVGESHEETIAAPGLDSRLYEGSSATEPAKKVAALPPPPPAPPKELPPPPPAPVVVAPPPPPPAPAPAPVVVMPPPTPEVYFPEQRFVEKSYTVLVEKSLNSLFAYIRNDRLVLRAKVESVEGALKLAELAERLATKQRIEFNFDWNLKESETQIGEAGCLCEVSETRYDMEPITKKNLKNCVYIGHIENVTYISPDIAAASTYKPITRIYFTTGPEFTDAFQGLPLSNRQRLAFFEKFQERK
jgi:hypothetical protein